MISGNNSILVFLSESLKLLNDVLIPSSSLCIFLIGLWDSGNNLLFHKASQEYISSCGQFYIHIWTRTLTKTWWHKVYSAHQLLWGQWQTRETHQHVQVYDYKTTDEHCITFCRFNTATTCNMHQYSLCVFCYCPVVGLQLANDDVLSLRRETYISDSLSCHVDHVRYMYMYKYSKQNWSSLEHTSIILKWWAIIEPFIVPHVKQMCAACCPNFCHMSSLKFNGCGLWHHDKNTARLSKTHNKCCSSWFCADITHKMIMLTLPTLPFSFRYELESQNMRLIPAFLVHRTHRNTACAYTRSK